MVVEWEAGVVVAPAVAPVVGRAGWAALKPPGRVATASALTVDIESRTWRVSPATGRGALSAARK